MSLNGQFGNENRLKASDANCFYQCWDLRKHQARTDLARAQIGVFEREKNGVFWHLLGQLIVRFTGFSVALCVPGFTG